MQGWIEFESGARCSLQLTFMDALPRPEDGGVGSRPAFGMAPGGGSTGGCRMDFEHGTAEFIGQTDVDDLGGRWHVHRTSSTSNTAEVLDPPRESDAEPEALLMAEFHSYINGGPEPPCSGRRNLVTVGACQQSSWSRTEELKRTSSSSLQRESCSSLKRSNVLLLQSSCSQG